MGAASPEPEKCGNCRYYLTGACLRYPPTVYSGDGQTYPEVSPDWWCGEWQGRLESR